MSAEPVATREQAATLAAERRLRHKLERAAESTLRIQYATTPEQVAQAICEAAREAFEASAAGLWRIREDDVELIWRSPPARQTPLGIRLRKAWMPTLAEQLGRGDPQMIADIAREEPELFKRMGRYDNPSRSQLRLPLSMGDGGPELALSVSWRDPQPEATVADLALSRRFADQASLAIAQALRRTAERDARALYEQLEASLLPSPDLDGGALRVATLAHTGDHRMRLGGDFYDAVALPGGAVAILLGDVAGHDPLAAALGAELRASWRALTLAGLAPAAVIAAMEHAVHRRMERHERLATLCACRIDGADAQLVLAGHPPPLLVDGAQVRPLAIEPGPPLGATDAGSWAPAPVALPPAWRLLLYSDGIVEGRARPGASERYGSERLERRLAELVAAGEPDGRILEGLLADARACNGRRLPDDVTLLLATA